jgi:hypothetical protein
VHTRSARRLVAAVVVLVMGGEAAAVEEQLLAGSRLALRTGRAGEHLVLVARDDVVAPLPGGSEDPTLVGAVVDVSNPRTGERARFHAPAADWTVNATGTRFRFRNAARRGPGAEIQAVVIRHRRRLKISTRALGITLDEDSQHALSVVVTTGTRRYCLLFGGRIGKDRPGRFVARNAPAPPACPTPPPIAGTTTTTVRQPPRPTTTLGAPAPTTTSTTAPSSTTTRPAGARTTTSTRRPPTSTSTTTTVRPTTVRPTSTSTSTRPPRPTTSSTTPPPTTTSTSPPPPTTSTTLRPCGRRGLFCGGACPPGERCRGLFVCACRPGGGRGDESD